MNSLSIIVETTDTFFGVKDLSKDPAMSRFVPMVYKNIPGWERFFESDFLARFNGLMIRGGENVQTIFAASFPHDEILKKFIFQAKEGDLLFLHHPINLECGDPKNTLGKGFLPINIHLLQQIIEKKLSIYTCHAPLDYNKKISTNRAIIQALDGIIKDEFLPYGNGYAGIIAEISPTNTVHLIDKLKDIFGIPYVDFAGTTQSLINRIGVVAGGGDEIEYSQTCKQKGAQAYITGEIFSHYTTVWGKENTLKITEYAKKIDMSLIGVSHSASEYLVMKTQIPQWFKDTFGMSVIPLPQKTWWV